MMCLLTQTPTFIIVGGSVVVMLSEATGLLIFFPRQISTASLSSKRRRGVVMILAIPSPKYKSSI
jgi:hypothetical protein